jgi:hypothetical protein
MFMLPRPVTGRAGDENDFLVRAETVSRQQKSHRQNADRN